MRANPIRFTGMASGMDTDSIVKDMMRPHQYKIDQEKKAQALVKLRQDAWKEMNKKLYDFHTNFTRKLSLQSTYNKKITTSSNTDVVGIAEGAQIPEGTHTIVVTQLAQSAAVVGRGERGEDGKDGKGIPKHDTVGDLMEGLTFPDKLVMWVNNKSVEVPIEAGHTLSDVAKNMNDQLKDTGWVANYDEKNASFFISSTVTGKEQTIQFDKTDEMGAKFYQKLGIKTGEDITGEDAIYTYNGSEFSSTSNIIEVNGVQATLKAEGTSTISSVADPDATYDFIKEFVTEYNKLIDEINLKLDTRPAKDIMPLTAEEREAMSESDIKLWEEKINSSLFYKDPQLTEFVDNARFILSNQFGGDLAALGIVTGPWSEKGKLHILGDEDDTLHAAKPNKLKEELAKNPQAVADKFYEIGQKLYTETNEKLIKGTKLKSALNFYNDKVMADEEKSFDKRIATLEERMYKLEDMHYRKFAAMEKMLSTLNSQGSWLAQQFGGY